MVESYFCYLYYKSDFRVELAFRVADKGDTTEAHWEHGYRTTVFGIIQI